jgi:hypothetical protein
LRANRITFWSRSAIWCRTLSAAFKIALGPSTLTAARPEVGYQVLLLPGAPTPPGVPQPGLPRPQINGSPAHYFWPAQGKAWPALNLLGGHPRAGARLRSLFVLARPGRAGGRRWNWLNFSSKNNMIWRRTSPSLAGARRGLLEIRLVWQLWSKRQRGAICLRHRPATQQ